MEKTEKGYKIENKNRNKQKNIEMTDLIKGRQNYFDLHGKYGEGIE